MRKYLALIKGGFLEGIAYKENFLTGLLANFVQVVVFYYVWKSIFLYHTEINGYTWEIMKKYVIVSFLCNSTFSFGFEMQTANSIISGNIITDLLKPLSYRSLTFFKAVGTAGMEFLITFLWCGTFLVMCNGMQNIEVWRVLLLLFSILLGMGIKFNIQYIFSMFWCCKRERSSDKFLFRSFGSAGIVSWIFAENCYGYAFFRDRIYSMQHI